MLLRSSSAPIAQTLFSDSPNRDFTPTTAANHHKQPQNLDQVFTNISFLHHHQHLNLRSFSCNSSPIQNSCSGYSGFSPKHIPTHRSKPIRRVQSDSNLEGLSPKFVITDDFCCSKTLTGSSSKQTKPMLQTEPSFCIYNTEDGFQENEKGEEKGGGDLLEKGTGSGEFSFGKKEMDLIKEEDEEGKEDRLSGFKNLGIEEEVEEPASPPMYLATGFGNDANGIGGDSFEYKKTAFDENGDVEEYYQRMVDEDPSSPLFLRNYAHFLKSMGDLPGAEEYYFRATLADPKDGEILMQYGKLVWELHHDQLKALHYFESAARVAPEDSHVLAAYASFLWEIDDEDFDGEQAHSGHIQIEEKGNQVKHQNSTFKAEERPVSPRLHLASGLGIDITGFPSSIDYAAEEPENPGLDGNLDEYYRRMVEQNPSNPSYLRNYAQFLNQTKGDLQGAKEYYSRAILADPGDGEVISQYAQLVWKLHRDQDKASCYFEQAVQASPGDSHVLAAYAGFLWDADEEDDTRLPVVLEGAMTSANA